MANMNNQANFMKAGPMNGQNDNYKISLKAHLGHPTTPTGTLPNVSSTNPKTPSPIVSNIILSYFFLKIVKICL